MNKTVFKWFWVWNFEKEEAWLNEMALKGWVLDGVQFCTYHFKSCEPGEFTIRLENHCLDSDYIKFMEETGATYVGRMVQYIYFRKKSELGAFNIFSDIDSRMEHLERIGKLLTAIGVLNLIIGLSCIGHLGAVNLVCATLLMYALGRIHGKKEALERERMLHE